MAARSRCESYRPANREVPGGCAAAQAALPGLVGEAAVACTLCTPRKPI